MCRFHIAEYFHFIRVLRIRGRIICNVVKLEYNICMEKKPLELKEIQKCALEILVKVAGICEQNKFRYSLAYGTLIGAIRHKGFIPWDDDIDIFMPRPDYDAFIEYLHNNHVDNLKLYNTKYSRNYPFAITRISDERYVIVESKYKNCGMGLFIDIYPIDGLGSTTEEALSKYKLTQPFVDEMVGVATCAKYPKRFMFTSTHKYLRLMYAKYFGSYSLQKRIENIVFKCDYDRCEYVGVPLWSWNKPIYKRAWFEEYVNVMFEGYEFKAIKAYDEYLRMNYGDYMQLPPKEEQIPHHEYNAYVR